MARKKSPPPPTAGSKSLAKIEAPTTISLASGGAMPDAASRRRISVIDVGPNTDEERQDLQKKEWSVLESKPHQLAFRLDPHNHNADYTCLYRIKPKGIPDPILKQMAIGDSLVGTIVRARENHASAFGKPRADRLSMGYYFEWRDKREYDNMPAQERDRWRERQDRASSILLTCGRTDGWSSSEQCSFGRWLAETTHSALTVGRIATEPVFVDGADGEPEFHSFRPVDAGTIFPTNKATARGGDAIRQRSEQLLRHLTGDQDLVVPEDEWDEYEYVQLIDGNPVQVFTDDQLLTRTMFPVPDVEYQGFPVTPCDIAVTEILTHLSIGRQNQLYFQNGRAARGMIVVTSEEVDPDMLMQMRQAFMASINGVSSAHRMPLFGLSKDDSVQWVPIDNSSRDMEFQYLNDNTSRAILSAYGMSPDELPGFAHLSRGTTSQALCLDLGSLLTVRGVGLITIADLLGGQKERLADVWDGTKWVQSRVFLSGSKTLASTKLRCGIRLDTSPDHRFRSIDENGQPCWVPQSELRPGSPVLVNKQPLPGSVAPLSYEGRELGEDMMEVLGWLTGDGNLHVRFHPRTGNMKQGVLSWYYHHDTEVSVWNRHFDTMVRFGLQPKHEHIVLDEEEKEKIKAYKGFATLSDERYRNKLYDSKFVKWLLALGFKASKRGPNGKQIPNIIHALAPTLRAAFLRGFFSSDGGRTGGRGGVRIVIHNDQLRGQMRSLLLGMGIRCQGHEGNIKYTGPRAGVTREKINASTYLVIKDRDLFDRYIGFVPEQAHKQIDPDHDYGERRWDCVPRSVYEWFAPSLLPRLSAASRKRLYTMLTPSHNPIWGHAKQPLIDLMAEVSLRLPAWLDDYHVDFVEEVSRSAETREMADLEVFNEEHAFVANGVVVHNSESNTEFKLEAARDVGIRPLVSFLEAVINDDIMPLIDRELAKKCRLVLWGLDAQTTDQEDAELTRAISLDGSLNDVLTKKEKQTLPRELGAGVPLNPQWHQLMQSYVPVGLIREKLLGDQGASGDPRYAYVRDPFYFQHVEAEQAKLEMLLQPPISAMAPLVLPGVLRVIFPLLSEAESKNAAAAILQQAQQMMQEQAEMAAQGEQEPQEGGEEPAQKAEPRVVIGMPQRKLLGRQRRLVDSSVRGLAAHLDKLTRELRQPS